MMVVELPADPMQYARAVRDCPVFERLTLSAEDRQTGPLLAAERQRATLEHEVPLARGFLPFAGAGSGDRAGKRAHASRAWHSSRRRPISSI